MMFKRKHMWLNLLLFVVMPSIILTGFTETFASEITNQQRGVVAIRPYIQGLEIVGTNVSAEYSFHDFTKCTPIVGTPNFQKQVYPKAQSTEICTMDSGKPCVTGDISTIQWYISDTPNGEFVVIPNETAKNYTIKESDLGKYISFAVTPKTQALTGKQMHSVTIGPIIRQDQFDKRDGRFNNANDYAGIVTTIQSEVFTKMNNATFFTVNTNVTTRFDFNIKGSKYAYVGSTRKAFDESSKPTVVDGKIYLPQGFFTNILGIAAPKEGLVELNEAATLLNKNIWTVGTKTGNYRLDSMGEGLIAIYDNVAPSFDNISDKNVINEAINMLFDMSATPEQMKWFNDAQYGMFVHWDMSSQQGVEISWDRRAKRPSDMSASYTNEIEPYYDTLSETFNPIKFDAKKLVESAKDAGMKYIVFTSKHHGGFSNFFSKYDNYTIENSPYNKDIVAEIVREAKLAGLKVGLYYSQRDWFNPYYLRTTNENHTKYLEYMNGQLSELLSNYGTIDLVWFDSCGNSTLNQWDLRTMVRRMKQINPELLINNRIIPFSLSNAPSYLKGDYVTPEQRIGAYNVSSPWESCVTMLVPPGDTGGWSYRPEASVRSGAESTKLLSNVITGGGNLLFNIGPMPTGEIDARNIQTLTEMGNWMDINSNSVYETQGGPIAPQTWGGTTNKVNPDGQYTVYFQVYNKPDGRGISVPALDAKKYTDVKLLRNGKPLQFFKSNGTYIFILPDGEVWDDSVTVIQSITQAGTDANTDTLNRTLLLNLIASCKTVIDNSIMYNKAQYQVFLEKYSNAQNVCFSINTTQAAIDLAYSELNTIKSSMKVITNKVLLKPAIASTSVSSSYDASKAIDGFTGTHWQTPAGTGSATLVAYFDKPTQFDTVNISEYLEVGEQTRVSYFSIDYWDDVKNDWEQHYLETSIGDNKWLSFEPVITTKVRLNIITCSSPVGITEFGVYNINSLEQGDSDEVDVNIALNKTATATNVYSSTYTANMAIDGNTGSRWATSNGVLSAMLTVDLGVKKGFNSVIIKEYLVSGEASRVNNFAIEYLNDNNEWVECYSGTAIGTVNTFNFNLVSANKIRLNIKSASKPVSFYEFEVYKRVYEKYPSTTITENFDNGSFDTSKWTNKGCTFANAELVLGVHKNEFKYNEAISAFVAEFDTKVSTVTGSWMGFMFGKPNADSTWDNGGKMFYVRSTGLVVTAGLGTSTTYQIPNFVAGSSVHVKVDVYGADVKCYINGVLAFDLKNTTYTPGYISFYMNGTPPSYLDNISVSVPQGLVLNNNLAINTASNSIFAGDIMQMNATIMPENATDKTVRWSVDNENIAKISTNGILTGISEGKVVVKATSNDGTNVFITKEINVFASKYELSFGQLGYNATSKMINVNIQVKNNLESELIANMIVGIYEGNKLTNMLNKSISVTGKGAATYIEDISNLGNLNQFKVKAFLWNDLNEISSLADVKEINNN